MQDSSPLDNPFNIPSFNYGYRPANKLPDCVHNPGPGAYETIDESPKAGGSKFPRSNRHDFAKEKLFIPGPGAYDTSSVNMAEENKKALSIKASFIGSPSKNSSFSLEKKSKDEGKVIQGLHASKSQFKVSFSETKKLNPIDEFNVPGPGTYNVREVYESPGKRSVGIIIGTAQRDLLGITQASKEGLLGPSYYSHNKTDILAKGNPQGHFTKGPKYEEPKEFFPGPGEYEAEVQVSPTRSKITNTFGNKPRILTEIITKGIPGPGKYEDQVNNTMVSKSAVMPISKRPDYITRNPGVGDYDIVDGFSAVKREAEKKAAFKKMMQTLQSSLNETGDFSTVSFLSRSKSIDATLNLNVKSNYVSNAFQEPLSTKPIKDTWVDTLIYNNSSPGPVYSFKNQSIEGAKIGTTFKKNPRQALNDIEIRADVPGPGSYVETLIEPVKTETGMGLPKGRRPSDAIIPLHVRKNPGVGKYETELKKLIGGGTIGRANRGLE